MSRGGHRYVRLPCGFARMKPVGNRPILCGPRAFSLVEERNPPSIHRKNLESGREKRLTLRNKKRTLFSSPELAAAMTGLSTKFPRAVNSFVDSRERRIEMFALLLITLFFAAAVVVAGVLADSGLRWWSAFGTLRRELNGENAPLLPSLRPAMPVCGSSTATRFAPARSPTGRVSRAA